MKGFATEFGYSVDEYDYEVKRAVVTDRKITLDWVENELTFHAIAESDDGVEYVGTFGAPHLDPSWTIEMTRYTAADGDVLLVVKWSQDDWGKEGWFFVELFDDPERE